MVPHSLICAKPKRHKYTKSPELHIKTRQTTAKFARHQPHSRPSAEAGRQAHFHLRHLGQSLTTERAGRAPDPGIGKRHCQTTNNARRVERPHGCAISRRRYNVTNRNLERLVYSAAGTLTSGGDYTQIRGSLQPDQRYWEPHFDPTAQTSILDSVANANNRLDQAVVWRPDPTTQTIYASQVQGNFT